MDWDSDLFKERGCSLFGPNKGQNKENFDKSSKSSHEPLVRMYWYSTWIILGARRFRFVEI